MKCNLCGSGRSEYLFSNFKKESARHADYPLDVHICRGCGLVFLNMDKVSEAALERYYTTSNTFERPGALFEGHKPLREGQMQWALDHLPADFRGKKVLDVGCGAGYVLKLFKDKGFQTWGNDYSPAMIRNLRELYGIDGYQGPFSPERVERLYDLITCITVLEHLPDPNRVLGEFGRTLAPGGFLFLEVPDAEFPRWDMVPDHIAYDHLYHWTERTLGRMLEQNGFEVAAAAHVENAPDSGNPECVLRMLARKGDNLRARARDVNDYEREKEVLRRYKEKHDGYLAGFQRKIDEVKKKTAGESLAIFCAGEHTATLLSRFDFSGLRIPFLFDNDPAVAGKSLAGIPVRHGSEAAQKEVRHYLLSTTNHEKAIYENLKKLDPDSRVYGLYASLD